MEKVKAMAVIKFNTNQTCADFYNSVKSQTDILRAVKSGQKYHYNKLTNTNGTLQLAENTNVEYDLSDEFC